MLDTLLLRVAGWGLLALALTGGAVAFIHHQRELGAAPERARAAQAEAAVSAVATARAEETRTAKAIQEAQDAQFKNALRQRDDARAAAAAHQRLLDRTAALGATCTAQSAAAPASSASGSASGDGLLLSDMLGRIDEAAGLLAARADARGGGGLLCERSYDSLTPPPAR